MSPTPARSYRVQTVARGTDTSGFEIAVGLFIVFMFAAALLASR